MKAINKMLKSMNLNATHIIAIVGFVVLVFVAVNYSSGKYGSQDGMQSNRPSVSNNSPMETQNSGVAQPAAPEGQNGGFAQVSGMQTSTQGLPQNCASKDVPDPSELLPKDQNNEWARLNPSGSNDFQNVNLLKAGYHSGIDTVGSTMRNANLQVRSEPPNPTTKVSPWMNSTIEPDLMRVPLEIGSGQQ